MSTPRRTAQLHSQRRGLRTSRAVHEWTAERPAPSPQPPPHLCFSARPSPTSMSRPPVLPALNFRLLIRSQLRCDAKALRCCPLRSESRLRQKRSYAELRRPSEGHETNTHDEATCTTTGGIIFSSTETDEIDCSISRAAAEACCRAAATGSEQGVPASCIAVTSHSSPTLMLAVVSPPLPPAQGQPACTHQRRQHRDELGHRQLDE